MSLDTKYRPLCYDDVLGQKYTVQILRELIKKDQGFHQSVLFAGPFGSGKTTVGRIFARALLCAQPTENGDPCDKCVSCRNILDTGASDAFIEVDAATNSGKADVKKITDELRYSAFSGRRRIYLFDESHQLSKDALDALLKPLEENVPGSRDKRLVCIFCTTEPERMRSTILSRCAPAFVIKTPSPKAIAKRLAFICEQEALTVDPEMLVLIAEMTECHIRDAIKAIEGVSMLGEINRENVSSYLHLDLHETYLDILTSLGNADDPGEILRSGEKVLERVSPGVFYKRLTGAAILAYQVLLGVKRAPGFWDEARIKSIGEGQGDKLLGIAERMAKMPARPTSAMVLCDLAILHHRLRGRMVLPTAVSQPILVDPVEISEKQLSVGTVEKSGAPSQKDHPEAYVANGVYRNERGMSRKEHGADPVRQTVELDRKLFCESLGKRVAELDGRVGST